MAHPGFDGYSYYISNDSDEEDLRLDSSDEEQLDEVSVFLRGTPEQKRKVLKSLTGDEASSSDEDFEKVMQGELEAKVKAMENSWKKSNEAKSSKALNVADSEFEASHSSKQNYYDDIYFDSDEEDKAKKQRLTDDELLYDPSADDEDQKWVDKQRKRVEKKSKAGKKGRVQLAEGSDAILTCPACMTTLCVDCQRHSSYQNQYRAMFVMNCNVKHDELLHYKEKKKRQFRRHRKRARKSDQDEEQPGMSSESFTREIQAENNNEMTDSYHPVKCTVCSTEVAVYDADEIYHFFNVLSGYA